MTASTVHHPAGGTDEAFEVQRRAERLHTPPGRHGTPVGDVCRQIGVSEVTFYQWKKKFAHLGVNEVRRVRQLEDENARLKRLVADLTLDKHMLAEALRKKA